MPEKKKRRANNEGSIRKRKSGLWEAQYTVGYTENGKAIRRSLYASSKKEVREKLWEVLQQIMRDEYGNQAKRVGKDGFFSVKSKAKKTKTAVRIAVWQGKERKK